MFDFDIEHKCQLLILKIPNHKDYIEVLYTQIHIDFHNLLNTYLENHYKSKYFQIAMFFSNTLI